MTGYTGPTAEEFEALCWPLMWLGIGIFLAASGYFFAARKERRGKRTAVKRW